MKLNRHGILAGVLLTAALALTACGTDDNNGPAAGSSSAPAGAADCATGRLTAQGSTAQKNAMEQWVKDFQTRCSGATVDYQGTGSGAGIQAFIGGTADFAGSDSAMKDPEEQSKADARCATGPAIHLPLVIGPIAVVSNVSGASDLQFSPATLAGIFANKITTWDAPEIKADNPSATLPATKILAVHRNDSSGTTDNFTKYLSKTAGDAWAYANSKEWKAPGGQGEKGSDGVSAAVKKTDGSIGYVEWSFAKANALNIAKVKNSAGEYTALSTESAGKTIASAAVAGEGNDLKLTVDYTTKAAGAYPIVLVTYEIVCEQGTPADKVALVKSFLGYAAGDGQAKLADLGYAPLPAEVQTKVAAAVKALS